MARSPTSVLVLSAWFVAAVTLGCGSNSSASSNSSSSGSASCLPAVGAADGQYLLTMSMRVEPKNPLLFDANLTTTDDGGTFLFSLILALLSAADRETIVGSFFEVGPFEVVADGSFVAPLPPLSVPGAANPISGIGLEIENVVLSGTLCSPADFVCGDFGGQITYPIVISLDGSTFTLERVVASYPEPPQISCDGDLADPL